MVTPEKDYNAWTSLIGLIGGMTTNVDVGIRNLLLAAAGAAIALLLGLGYNSLMDSMKELKDGQAVMRVEWCQNFDKLDARERSTERAQVEIKTLLENHLGIPHKANGRSER